MMEISYKVPFLDMLDEVKHQIKTGNGPEIVSMFMEIAEDVEIDAENCDTPTNALANIANIARAASNATVSESRYSRQKTYDLLRNLFAEFENLDDSDIVCEVEDSATSPFTSRYGKL